ncbi:MAG: DUF3552 domain-containing protein, partial [Calditrichaeota bacterium]|nr:DUF3552 domain-containing protein [Calditrichota bacterium]
AAEILEQAERNAQKIEKESYLRSKERFQRDRAQIQKKNKQRESEIARNEERIRRKEKDLRRLENSIHDKESALAKQQKQIEEAQERLSAQEARAEEIVNEQVKRLEALSGMNREEAKRQLLNALVNEAKSEAAQEVLDIRRDATTRARWEAIEIMAHAIERMATDYTMESTLVTVSLPNDN